MGSRRFLVVSSSLFPSLFSLSLSLFLGKCPADKHTHENKHTKTRRQRVYARTLHLFPPARGVFITKSRIHKFSLPRKKGNRINKNANFGFENCLLWSDEFVSPSPSPSRLRAVETVGSSSHGLCGR